MRHLKRIRHRIAHWFGWNLGSVVSWWGDDKCAYIGFQCATCGEVTGERMRGWPAWMDPKLKAARDAAADKLEARNDGRTG